MLELSRCPQIHRFDGMRDFAEWFKPCPGDLFLMDSRAYVAQSDSLGRAQVVYLDHFCQGEPDDRSIEEMASAIRLPYARVVGIGGGSVLDTAKLLSLDTLVPVGALFSNKREIARTRRLTLLPTTCGTGSEVTCIAVVTLKKTGAKLGLSDPALYADEAVLIPSLLHSLPYRVFALSALDALVHAVESYVSPKATPTTRMLSSRAASVLLGSMAKLDGITKEMPGADMLGEFQLAATYAGLAFGTAGCGTVHAMSYPLGEKYHVPHGEANYLLFMGVLAFYSRCSADAVAMLNGMLSDVLKCSRAEAQGRLARVTEGFYPRRDLKKTGMVWEDIADFAASVVVNQQRLLKNGPIPMDAGSITEIYQNVFERNVCM